MYSTIHYNSYIIRDIIYSGRHRGMRPKIKNSRKDR